MLCRKLLALFNAADLSMAMEFVFRDMFMVKLIREPPICLEFSNNTEAPLFCTRVCCAFKKLIARMMFFLLPRLFILNYLARSSSVSESNWIPSTFCWMNISCRPAAFLVSPAASSHLETISSVQSLTSLLL